MISSAVSFLKENCRTDPEPAIKAMVGAVIKCLSDARAFEQILPEETIPESHASLGALHGWHNLFCTIFCKDKFERYDSIWVNRRCYSSVRAVACVTRHLAAEQISAKTEWSTAFGN